MLLILAIFFASVPRPRRAVRGERSHRARGATPTGRAPACCRRPRRTQQARLIVFTGTAGAWKGIFAVHSWIVFKRAGDRALDAATTWSAGASRCAPTTGRSTAAGTATRRGPSPTSRGADAERLIPRVEAAVAAYSYAQAGDYRVWPGPNSNTFVAAVLRAVPELRHQRCRRTRSAATSAPASMPA